MTIRIPYLMKKKVFRRPPLDQIQEYMIFYGEPTDEIYEKLANYELVILEAQLHSRERIQWLLDQGTTVLGYLSVMETPQWNNQRFKKLNPQNFFSYSDRPLFLSEWNAYLMDLRKAHYRDLLLQEAFHILDTKGYSGLFLDTVDDIDTRLPNELQEEFLSAYLNFIESLRSNRRNSILIQNRGFSALVPASSYIDGFLWEDWNGNLRKNAWIRLQLQRISKVQEEGLVILSLSHSSDPLHQREAEKAGFIHLSRRDYRSADF